MCAGWLDAAASVSAARSLVSSLLTHPSTHPTQPADPSIHPTPPHLHYCPQMKDEKCVAAGFSAFICKPFRVEDVERVLALVRPRAGAAPAPAGSHDAGAGI